MTVPLYFAAAAACFIIFAALHQYEKTRTSPKPNRDILPAGYAPHLNADFSMTPALQNGERVFVNIHLSIDLTEEVATNFAQQTIIPLAQEQISLWALTFKSSSEAFTEDAYRLLRSRLLVSSPFASVRAAAITAVAPIKPKGHEQRNVLQSLQHDVLLFRELTRFNAEHQDDPLLAELINRRVETEKKMILDPEP